MRELKIMMNIIVGLRRQKIIEIESEFLDEEDEELRSIIKKLRE